MSTSLSLRIAVLLISAFFISSPHCRAQNLLTNPGFESGGFGGWSAFGNAFAETASPPRFVPGSGQGLASMYGPFVSGFGVSGIFQQFATIPGERFEMNAWSRHWSGDALTGAGAPSDNWVVMKIAFQNSAGVEIGGAERTILDGSFATDTWHAHAPIQGTAPPGAATAQALVLFLQPALGTGASHIDDVSFRRVDSYVPQVALKSRIAGNGRLQIQEVRPDGSRAPWSDFEIKGVNMGWTPLGLAPWTAPSPLTNPNFLPVLDRMKETGANLLRFYFLPPGTGDPSFAATVQMLDLCYLMGFKVMLTAESTFIGSSTAQAQLSDALAAYANHPAVLAFCLGNEWNLTLSGAALSAKANQVQGLAAWLQAADPDRVVMSSLACGPHNDILRPRNGGDSQVREIVNTTPDVDFYGMNLYRSYTFLPLFYLWAEESGNKPYAVFEYGSDSWDQNAGALALAASNDDMLRHLDESHRAVAGPGNQPFYNGMIAFAAVDEWWKHNGPGNSVAVQESAGFFTTAFLNVPSNPQATLAFRADLDGHRSEEHFGLVDLPLLNRKPVFFGLRSRFLNEALPRTTLELEVFSSGYVGTSGGLDNGYWGLRVNGNAVFFQEGGAEARGLSIAVFDRSVGNITQMQSFDTFSALGGGSSSAISDAVAFLNAIPSGSLVSMAIADTFTHWSGNAAPLAPLIAAIQSRFGSSQLNAAHPFRAGWCMLGYADSTTPLSEGTPALAAEVTAAAAIPLDLDADGINDFSDPDIDNDGRTNASELAAGTDPVRPAGELLTLRLNLDATTRLLSIQVEPGDASGTLANLDFPSLRLEVLTPTPADLSSFLLNGFFTVTATSSGGVQLTSTTAIPPLPGVRVGIRFLDSTGKLQSKTLPLD